MELSASRQKSKDTVVVESVKVDKNTGLSDVLCSIDEMLKRYDLFTANKLDGTICEWYVILIISVRHAQLYLVAVSHLSSSYYSDFLFVIIIYSMLLSRLLVQQIILHSQEVTHCKII